MKKTSLINAVLAFALPLASCSQEDEQRPQAEEQLAAAEAQSGSPVLSEIDATHRQEWVGFDLDGGRFVESASLPADADWDLGFKRTSIKLNGEAVEVMKTKDQSFDSIVALPTGTFIKDQTSSDPQAKETAGLAFHRDEDWYVYDAETHVISSRAIVYVVKSNRGRHFKLTIKDYYSADRLPSFIQLQWKELKP